MTTIMEKEIFQQKKVLLDCLNYNEKTLNTIAEQIRSRGITNVVLAARGSSDNAGTYFKYAFESLTGLPVALAAPSVNTLYGGTLKLSKSLVIGVSQSGAAEDVMQVLKNAADQKALTVSITNNPESKMANMTEFHLFCNAGPELSVAATKTFLSQMFLMAQLAARTAKCVPLIDKYNNLWQKLDGILNLEPQLKELAEKLVNVNSAYVIARGLNFAIAQEASLKLQETCYLNARPYAASDFLHGPFALVDENSTVILLAPSGNSQNDVQALKTRLLDAGAKVLVITDKKELAEGATYSVVIPESNDDFMTPFYNVVVAQLLACKLSVARGLNPDAPRGLKKVTVTK